MRSYTTIPKTALTALAAGSIAARAAPYVPSEMGFGVCGVLISVAMVSRGWVCRIAMVLAVVVGAIGAIAIWQLLFGNAAIEQRVLAEQLEALQRQLTAESGERQRLAGIANAADSQLTVAQTAAERLAREVKNLEAENGRLKADLAYLESLLPAGPTEGPVAIRRFEVEPDASTGLMRYRALLTQGGRGDRDFEGSLQLVVSTMADGKPGTLTWPKQGAEAERERMKVAFRRYRRVEGMFEVPGGTTVRAVQLRVMEGGAVRAQETVVR
jgi:hypothetical protein